MNAAEVSADDGQDPVAFHDRRRWHQKPPGPGRKALQVCSQVKDALLTAIADGVVVSVEPSPHAGRLLVTVAVPETADVADRAAVEASLTRQAGALRAVVAAAVTRRKAPELVFRVA